MMTTLRVGVNLLWLRPGEVGGSEEYLVRQLLGLAASEDAKFLDVTLFASPALRAAHPELAAAFEIVDAPVDGVSRARRVLVESTWLVTQIRRRRLDVIHHGGGTLPAVRGRAAEVLTVHDLQVLTYPQYFSATKRAYLRAALRRSLRRFDAVAVPSEFVAGTVRERCDVRLRRVVVVPHPVPPSSPEPTPEVTLRARYRLPERFVVYPAITHPHKDHVTLLRAIARVPDLGAVLLGGRGSADDDVAAEIDRLELSDRVVRPGRVTGPDRDGCYLAALALAFPSRYEGFGAPVLEAMALGCPAVVADATALPEVAGDAAVLVPPGDVDAWADALAAVAADPPRRAALAAAGRRRASEFTAARAADALHSAYRSSLPW